MNKTRILSIFLSVCMILTCMAGLGITASATMDYYDIEITLGENQEVLYGDLVQTGIDGAMYEVMIEADDGYIFDSDEFPITVDGITAELVDGNSVSVRGMPTNNVTMIIPDAKRDNSGITFTYRPGEGTGDDIVEELDPPIEVTLPDFPEAWTLPDGVNVRFIGWKIGDTVYEAGASYEVTDDSVVAVAQYEDIYGFEDEDDDDDDGFDRPEWADKPEYKPSGASGTAAPEEKPAEEPKDNDKQEEPKDNDKQEEPKDNDTTEIPEDKDTGNDGTSTVVDGSRDTNENPHTGAALGGLAVLALAGAALIVSKKRK